MTPFVRLISLLGALGGFIFFTLLIIEPKDLDWLRLVSGAFYLACTPLSMVLLARRGELVDRD